MRVLVATNMFPTAGREADGIFVAREVEALRRYEPDVEIEVVHIDTVGSRARYVTGQGDVARAIRAFRPDILHVHFGMTQALCFAWNGPRVITYHGSDLTVGWKRAVSKTSAFLRPGQPIVVSPTLTPFLSAEDRPRALVVSCGVDPDVFRPDSRREARMRLGSDADDGSLVIGFPSTPARPEKDFALFSDTLRELTSRGHAVRGVNLTRIAPSDMPDALRALDLLLMTSRFEASPVMTKEALCCGVPVVSVSVGDVREQLTGFTGCRVVDTRDPRDLADAVVTALGDAPPSAEVAAGRFGIRTQAQLVGNIYRRVLEQR